MRECPECGEDAVVTHTWSKGGQTKECEACHWAYWEPPSPTIRSRRKP